MATPSITQSSAEIVATGVATSSTTLTGVAAGSLLVVTLVQPGSAVRTYTVSDDVNGSWGAPAIELNSSQTANISYKANSASGTIQVTTAINLTTGTWRWRVHEVANAATVSPLDAVSSLAESVATNTHACAATAGEIDTVAEVIVFCACTTNAATSLCSPGATYTEFPSGLSTQVVLQYKTSASALTDEQGTWTNTGTARTGRSVIASFKGAAGAGPSSIVFNLQIG